EIFREALPGMSRVAYLGSKEEKDREGPWGQSVRTAAQALGVTLVLAEFSARQYADAFAQVTRARAEAVFVSPSLLAFADRALVVELATRARMPTMFAYRQQVEFGGLMSFGVNVVDNFRRAARFVGRILQGTKAADLGVGRPRKVEVVIKLKTAKALGLTIPAQCVEEQEDGAAEHLLRHVEAIEEWLRPSHSVLEISESRLTRLALVTAFSPALSLLRACESVYGEDATDAALPGIAALCLGSMRRYFNRPLVQQIIRQHRFRMRWRQMPSEDTGYAERALIYAG